MKNDVPADESQSDTSIEASERYEEGLAGTAEADDDTDRNAENGERVG